MGGRRSRADARSTRGEKAAGNRVRERRARERAEAGPDQVICLLCGKAFRAVRVSHLRRKHGFEGDHPVEDYKRRFGLRVAACRDTCRTLADHRVARAKREGRHWTKASIKKELRRKVRAGQSVAPAHLDDPFYQTVRRRFGSWAKALRYAGLDPDEHRSHPLWDERKIKQAIRERHAAGEPLFRTTVEREQVQLYGAAVRTYGSWRNALRAAGFDPRDHHMRSRYSLAKARAWVHARRAAGLSITAGHVPRGLYDRVVRDVEGGWTAFIESLGLPYPGQKHRRWTDESVLAEIRSLGRRGDPLNKAAVVKAQGQGLLKQARQRFGSWDEALRVAGFDPAKIRKWKNWSPALVLDAIRARHRAGRTLDRPRVRERDRRLLRAAEKHFAGGWPEALRAAGFDPAKVRRSRRWSPAVVLDAICARHRAGQTLDRPRVRKQDRRLLRAAEKHFAGGWPEAVEAAGLGPRRRRARRK